jgi:hypothetical protein
VRRHKVSQLAQSSLGFLQPALQGALGHPKDTSHPSHAGSFLISPQHLCFFLSAVFLVGVERAIAATAMAVKFLVALVIYAISDNICTLTKVTLMNYDRCYHFFFLIEDVCYQLTCLTLISQHVIITRG